LIEDKVREGQLPVTLREDFTPRESTRKVEEYMGLMAKGFAYTVVKKMSQSVGVADQEQAYDAAIRVLPKTNATDIIDIAVKLDHYRGFPESEIVKFAERVRTSPFATGLLQWLIIGQLMLYRVDPKTRATMAKILKADAAGLRALQAGTLERSL
jgi:hypothetical protein